MDNMIPRYHLVMSRDEFHKKRKSGHFNGFYNNLSYTKTEKSVEKFLTLLQKIGAPWHWNRIGKYNDIGYLTLHLKKETTKLHYLLENMKVIGYALIIEPDKKSLDLVHSKIGTNNKIIEIENLGLFPSKAGNGKGGKFFEMIMADLFKNHDYVYWSMSSTNHPRLLNYYTETLGMKHIDTNYAPDFRPEHTDEAQAA